MGEGVALTDEGVFWVEDFVALILVADGLALVIRKMEEVGDTNLHGTGAILASSTHSDLPKTREERTRYFTY